MNLPPTLHTDGKLVEIDGRLMFEHAGLDGRVHLSQRPRLYWRQPMLFDPFLFSQVGNADRWAPRKAKGYRKHVRRMKAARRRA